MSGSTLRKLDRIVAYGRVHRIERPTAALAAYLSTWGTRRERRGKTKHRRPG